MPAATAVDLSLLSRRGVYDDLIRRTPSRAAIEYVPDQALWSDGVDKRRWLILPPGTQIDTSDIAHWRFPVGTKLVKEFALGETALETRIIEKIADTGDLTADFFLGTFVWTPEQHDARLTTIGMSNVNGTSHDVPQQELCLQCHQSEPNAVLGVSAVQLSQSGLLTQLGKQGLLTVDPGRTFLIPGDDLQRRAVGVLHANCGHCHSEGGMGSMMRMRFLPHEADLPFEQSELYRSTIGQVVTDWKPHPAEYALRIAVGDPDRSAVVYRMQQRSGNGFTMDQMPPIATEQRDERGIALVRTWIASLPHVGSLEDVDAGEVVDAGIAQHVGGALDASAADIDAGVPEEDARAPATDGDSDVNSIEDDASSGVSHGSP